MKLIEMRCPNCDAPLSVNADRDEAFCHHCNTTFLIEDAPKAESRNRFDAAEEQEAEQQELEDLPAEATVEFKTAKSEPPETGRFASAVTAAPEAAERISAPAAATQVSSGSASSTSEGSYSSKAKDGFPCDLDSTASFNGVTIPIDGTWKDYSPAWDWRHYAVSYTAAAGTREDVRISISTFTGGDTKNAIAFMEDYADFAPIFLDSGEYTIVSEDVQDGVTYTRVEGVDSHYMNLFSANPPSRYEKIREMSAGDVVRCVCLVGYAEDGTGFAAAVALCGSADNDECLYSAKKILDGVTFVPAECDVDSHDLWLYEVQH